MSRPIRSQAQLQSQAQARTDLYPRLLLGSFLLIPLLVTFLVLSLTLQYLP